MHRVVIDTNVFVAACLGGGHGNQVIRACIMGQCLPIMGSALLMEYEDVLGRHELMDQSPLTPLERLDLLKIFLSKCEWTRVYFGWRPNLPDEADNHLIELAVAGGASHIVSRNLKDLMRGELRFPQIKITDPAQYLLELSTWAH
ncbi:MAG: putative toxin-antitoxin system toxin component, PIN family [Brachymonas sp.]|nr:putative toxin-antitoxin system toxin component, PIN family [Brachymonas sp.]